jgi:hypothetical protein
MPGARPRQRALNRFRGTGEHAEQVDAQEIGRRINTAAASLPKPLLMPRRVPAGTAPPATRRPGTRSPGSRSPSMWRHALHLQRDALPLRSRLALSPRSDLTAPSRLHADSAPQTEPRAGDRGGVGQHSPAKEQRHQQAECASLHVAKPLLIRRCHRHRTCRSQAPDPADPLAGCRCPHGHGKAVDQQAGAIAPEVAAYQECQLRRRRSVRDGDVNEPTELVRTHGVERDVHPGAQSGACAFGRAQPNHLVVDKERGNWTPWQLVDEGEIGLDSEGAMSGELHRPEDVVVGPEPECWHRRHTAPARAQPG